MGVWGADTLSNDAAADFLIDLEESDDLAAHLESALDPILKPEPNPADDDFESEALAAAEMIAAAGGYPVTTLSQEARAVSLMLSEEAFAGLRDKAEAVVARIQRGGFLYDQWAETEEWSAWRESVNGLLARLAKSKAH